MTVLQQMQFRKPKDNANHGSDKQQHREQVQQATVQVLKDRKRMLSLGPLLVIQAPMWAWVSVQAAVPVVEPAAVVAMVEVVVQLVAVVQQQQLSHRHRLSVTEVGVHAMLCHKHRLDLEQ